MDLLSVAEVELVPMALAFFSATFSALSALNLFSGPLFYPREAKVSDGQSFDVIIVGAGSAGCVVASRLSEVENLDILLIEAGDDPQVDAIIPSLFPLITYSEEEWKHYSEDDGYTGQLHKKKGQHYITGKMLGGSSGSNFMFYVRGHKEDYENWVKEGATGWDWDTVLYYFKKSEKMTVKPILNGPSANLHNSKGYLGVSRPEWGNESIKYLEAFKENGHKINVDTNDINPLGYSEPSYTIDPPLRQSTALTFLGPAKDRKNLFVLKKSTVRKIIFDENKRAVGVEVNVHGKTIERFYAKKEVILSAGALNSPKILMSSGVGPKEHLQEIGVPLILDSPNVGKNLQDHPTVPVTLTGKKNILTAFKNLETFTHLATFPVPVVMGFASLNRTNPNAYPDYETVAFALPAATVFSTGLCTYTVDYEDYICENFAHSGQNQETFLAFLSFLHPESRGSVKLRSCDPEDLPLIDAGYYKVEADLDKHADMMLDFVSVIYDSTYFRNVESTIVDYGIKECKDLTFGSHEYWKCHVRNSVQTEWHLTGTCAMGREGVGVTDERLRVRGLKGIRVVDGGAVPLVTSGNTNAPIIMLAERASDLIKEDNGWPVEKVQFE